MRDGGDKTNLLNIEPEALHVKNVISGEQIVQLHKIEYVYQADHFRHQCDWCQCLLTLFDGHSDGTCVFVYHSDDIEFSESFHRCSILILTVRMHTLGGGGILDPAPRVSSVSFGTVRRRQ